SRPKASRVSICWRAAPGTSRGGSMSSMRSFHRPPRRRAISQLPRAATSEPKCSGPVGEGAKRPTGRAVSDGLKSTPEAYSEGPGGGIPVAMDSRRADMFKRVALFLATNLAVLALVSVVLSLLNAAGVDLGNNGTLLVFAALLGFGGSL